MVQKRTSLDEFYNGVGGMFDARSIRLSADILVITSEYGP